MNKRSYPDMHDHIKTLESAGLVHRITRPINKDTELHPLVRWQFRGGIPETERKAFLFEHVTDSKGRVYDIPVIVGALATNRKIYGIGINRPLDQINETWQKAIQNPIAPVVVEYPACQEIVYQGDDLVNGHGVDELPIPISTPGFDNAPYVTCSMYISRDPDTGLHNVGVYRAMVKSPTRLGMNPSIEMNQGIYDHWLKYRERGEPMPVAIAIGGPPAMTFSAVQKLPKHMDEFSVAGGLLGTPLQVAKAKTVDLFVPAEAEIVVEGFIDTQWLEPEGCFGESHGHVNLKEYNPVMNVTAVTRRKDAVYVSIISQVTPSESSLLKRVAFEPALLTHMRNALNIKSVMNVSMHEPLTNLRKLVVLQLKSDTRESEIWRALYGAAQWSPAVGKIVVAVNEDIDPEDANAIFWAMCYRMKPHRDVAILKNRDPGHGPRTEPNDSEHSAQDSAMLINAMLKEKFPPISLPKKKFMEDARLIWGELGLPPLSPQMPWYGYSLGDWSDEFEVEAERAVRGDYWITGQENYEKRRDDVMPNDQYRR